jgi:sulfate permease
MLASVALLVSFFFALNIGASGAAATMGIVYGSGAIKRRTIALMISGLGVFLGAAIGGGEVVKTIGSGIISPNLLHIEVVVVILISAALSLFLANIFGIPLSTSEITVGSVVGVGIAFQALYFEKLLYIVSFWIVIPVIALFFAYIIGKVFQLFKQRIITINEKWRSILIILLVISGFFEAFSAGMNNVANAVGPLVGAGLLTVSQGTLLGGVFVALGAVFLGKRVLETNGKRITKFTLVEGISISMLGANLVIIASLFGLPIPLTQVTTCSILGIGASKNGFSIWQKRVVSQILKVWLVSPFFSLIISYSLIKLIHETDVYSVFVLISMMIATVGAYSMMKAAREEKSSIHENSGGIQ